MCWSNIHAFDPFLLNGKRPSLFLAGPCTDLHDVIAATLDQLPVVGDHENGSAVLRFAFQPLRDQAHILPVKAAGRLVEYQYPAADRKSTRLNSSHDRQSRMPSSA